MGLLYNLMILLVTVFATQLCSAVSFRNECPFPCWCEFLNNDTVIGLNCSNLRWKQIPPYIQIPTSVKYLSLAYNDIEVIQNGTFQNLSKLESLDLSHNKLKTMEYSCFDGLTSLIWLNLSHNSLYMTKTVYPPGIFRNLKALKVLHIHANFGESVPNQNYPDVALADLSKLETLSLDGITGMAFGKNFQKLKNLHTLDMCGSNQQGYCSLLYITNSTFLHLNNTKLSVLKLVECDINRIDPSSFSALKNLYELDLSENHHLAFEGMKNASYGLKNTNITILRLNRINRHGDPFTLKKESFVYFNTTHVNVLTLNGNLLNRIEPEVIDALPVSLTYLSLRDNQITNGGFLKKIARLNNLVTLDVSFQLAYTSELMENVREILDRHLITSKNRQNDNIRNMKENAPSDVGREEMKIGNNRHLVDTQVYKDNVLTPHMLLNTLTSFSINNNGNNLPLTLRQNKSKDTLQLPVNVKYAIASHLKLNPLVIPALSFNENNSLEYLDLSSNGLGGWTGKWTGLHKLLFLNVSCNGLMQIIPDSFGDMPNLKTLLLNGNKFSHDIMNDKNFLLFSNQTELQLVDLSDNGLIDLPVYIFSSQRNLKHLNLSQNYLPTINFRLRNMINLKQLDLSNNRLTQFLDHTMEEMDYIARQSNITVNLSGNPLMCSCSQLNFLQWLLITKVNFHNFQHYECKYINGSGVSMSMLKYFVEQLKIECMADEVILISAITFVGLFLLVSIPAILYHKRWKLTYLYYIGRKVNPYEVVDEEQDEKEFDVYLSYSDSSRCLSQQIESYLTRNGLKVCFPGVNYNLGGGRDYVETVEGIQKSACVLVLLTNDYDQLFEFNMAVYDGISINEQYIIPVIVEPLKYNIDKEILMYVKANQAYVVWEEEDLFTQIENDIRFRKERRKIRLRNGYYHPEQ